LPRPFRAVFDVLGVDPRELPSGETEEDPESMYYGELWAQQVVHAVPQSPSWARTLPIYTYDEHGGYYDHVAPPPAIPSDAIPPARGPRDPPGGYDSYGLRVPAVIHDHTSVLATIKARWNLPALTDRDANAATVMDFLDLERAALLTRSVIPPPPNSGPSGPLSS
jgi:phospholipase C